MKESKEKPGEREEDGGTENRSGAVAALSSSISPCPPSFFSPPPLPPRPTLSSPVPTLLPPLLSLMPLSSLPSLPPSPEWSCSIWEGLLGLASLQCRKKGTATVSVRCAEGWCTRRNAFTRCVDLFPCACGRVPFQGCGIWNKIFTGIHDGYPSWVCCWGWISHLDERMCDCRGSVCVFMWYLSAYHSVFTPFL